MNTIGRFTQQITMIALEIAEIFNLKALREEERVERRRKKKKEEERRRKKKKEKERKRKKKKEEERRRKTCYRSFKIFDLEI